MISFILFGFFAVLLMEFFDFESASAADRGCNAFMGVCPSGTSAIEVCPAALSDNTCPHLDEFFACTQPELEGQIGSSLPEEMAGFGHFPTWIPNMSIPASPCDYCRSTRLECLLRYESQTACSSCVALSKNCSFSQASQERGRDRTARPRRQESHVDGSAEQLISTATPDEQRLQSLLGCTQDVEHADDSSRRNRNRFSRESVKVLKDWLANHANHPYPTKEQQDALKAATGLKRSQISTWLANARRRGKVRPKRGASPGLGMSLSRAVDIPSTLSSMSIKDMDPLERWKHSPPEHEPASVSAIANAVATSNYPTAAKENSSSSSSWADPQRDSSTGSSFSVFQAPSMSSVETKRSGSSEFSYGSGFSHQSQSSFGSKDALKRKDRRRRHRTTGMTQRGVGDAIRMFQCTFCTDSFKTKFDWQRHEKSLHLSLEKWTCAPLGGSVIVDGHSVCVYCGAADITLDHLETHNHQQCQEKDVAERTFYRKDHLRQHLRLTHFCRMDSGMESWKSSPKEVRSRCGFCDEVCTTWQERVDHLAGHFRNGLQMADWKGDWGFEPQVDDLVESAMPLWMIDNERRTPAPFSASATLNLCQPPTASTNITTGTSSTRQQLESIPGDAYAWLDSRMCFQELERILSIWASEQSALGVQLTDDMLQDEARRIVYMSADPWNQTVADDPQWLGMFKKRYGLSPVREVSREEEEEEMEMGDVARLIGEVRV